MNAANQPKRQVACHRNSHASQARGLLTVTVVPSATAAMEEQIKRRKLDQGRVDDGAQENNAPYANSFTEGQNGDLMSRPNFFNGEVVDGDMIPRFPVKTPLPLHVRNLRCMPIREDDVIIAAFAKSGTHWVWEMTQMLTSGKAEYDPRSKHHFMIEFNEAADLETLASPRVLNSHLYLRQLSYEIVTKRPRVIHIMRNPKDIMVSFYFHLKQYPMLSDLQFDSFVRGFLTSESRGPYLDYFTYMQTMFSWQREHPEVPVFNIFYEDIKQDPEMSVRQLAQFLQCWDATDELCSAIAQACSFSHLKHAVDHIKAQDRPGNQLYEAGKPNLLRKGEVGDWKNHFTMALNEHFDQVLAKRFKDYGIPPFKYCL